MKVVKSIKRWWFAPIGVIALVALVARFVAGPIQFNSGQLDATGANSASDQTATQLAATPTIQSGNLAAGAVVDTEKPTMTRTAPAGSLMYLNDTKLEFAVSDDVALAKCTINISKNGSLVKSNQPVVSGTSDNCSVVLTEAVYPDGDYSVKFNATDASGKVSATGGWTFSIQRDTEKPVVSQTKPDDLSKQVFKTGPSTVTIHATDNISLAKVVANVRVCGESSVYKTYQASSLNGKTEYDLTFDASSYPAGKYCLKYNALDENGNMSTTESWSFTVDNQKPVIEKVSPAQKVFKVGPTLTLHATDDVSLGKIVANLYKNDKTTLIKSNQSSNLSGQTDASYAVSFASLDEGEYCVKFNAADEAGNISNTEWYCFIIDQTKPEVEKTAPDSDQLTKGDEITIHATDNYGLRKVVANIYTKTGNEAQGEKGTLVKPNQVTLDGNTAYDFKVSLAGLDDGDYCVWSNALDQAYDGGNMSATSYWCFSLKNDREKPVVVLTNPDQSLDNPTLSKEGSLTIKATDNVALSKVVMNLHYYDGTTVGSVVPGKYWQSGDLSGQDLATFEHTMDLSGLADGQYCVKFNAVDTSDNVSLTTTWCFTIKSDTEKPTVEWRAFDRDIVNNDAEIVVAAKDNQSLNTIVVNIHDENNEAFIKSKTLRNLDGQTDATFTLHVGDYGLADGKYCARYNAKDTAGNLSSTGVKCFTVDNTAPEILPALADGKTVCNTGTLELIAKIEETNPDIYGVHIDEGLQAKTIDSDLPSGEYTFNHLAELADLADGEHTVTYTATDLAGNMATKSVRFTVDSTQCQWPTADDMTFETSCSADRQAVVTLSVVNGLADYRARLYLPNDLGSSPRQDVLTDATSRFVITTNQEKIDAGMARFAMFRPLTGSYSALEKQYDGIDCAAVEVTPHIWVSSSTNGKNPPTIAGRVDFDTTTVTVVVTGNAKTYSYTAQVGSDRTWSVKTTATLTPGSYEIKASATDISDTTVTAGGNFTIKDESYSTPNKPSNSTSTKSNTSKSSTKSSTRSSSSNASNSISNASSSTQVAAATSGATQTAQSNAASPSSNASSNTSSSSTDKDEDKDSDKDADKNKTDTTLNDTNGDVLGSNTDTQYFATADTSSTDNTADTGKQCWLFGCAPLGICWYWWILALIVIGLVVWFVIWLLRDDEDEEDQNSPQDTTKHAAKK